MPFPGVQHQAYWNVAELLQVAVELERLTRVNSGVVFSVKDKDRCPRLLDVVDGTAVKVPVPVVVEFFSRVHEVHLVGDVGGAAFRYQIADAHKHNACGESLCELGRTPGTGIAAIGTTGDADPFRVDKPRFDQVVDRVNEIIELLARVVALAQLGELDTAPRASSIVGVENGETVSCGNLPRVDVTA